MKFSQIQPPYRQWNGYSGFWNSKMLSTTLASNFPPTRTDIHLLVCRIRLTYHRMWRPAHLLTLRSFKARQWRRKQVCTIIVELVAAIDQHLSQHVIFKAARKHTFESVEEFCWASKQKFCSYVCVLQRLLVRVKKCWSTWRTWNWPCANIDMVYYFDQHHLLFTMSWLSVILPFVCQCNLSKSLPSPYCHNALTIKAVHCPDAFMSEIWCDATR